MTAILASIVCGASGQDGSVGIGAVGKAKDAVFLSIADVYTFSIYDHQMFTPLSRCACNTQHLCGSDRLIENLCATGGLL